MHNTDKSKERQVKVIFGIGQATSIGIADVITQVVVIRFQIVSADTPFLFSLQDIDNLRVKFDNLENVLLHQKNIPIIRKNGHPFLLLNISSSMAYTSEDMQECHLTISQLRQLHRSFGHPSVRRLQRVLERSGHDVDVKAFKRLNNFCNEFQLNGKSPGRFKFTLHDDCELKFSIYIDIFYLDGQPILHVVDESTRFQAARWVKNMTAQHAWEALRACWIDVYIGPPDMIIYDTGPNFASSEFRQSAISMSIITKEVPVDAHNSIGKVERYHGLLRQAYNCIKEELQGMNIGNDAILQVAVKAINDTAGPDGLVPTLLVFGAFPRMNHSDPPSLDISKRASAIKTAMREVRKLNAERQVKEALNMRNGPRTHHLIDIPLNSDVFVGMEEFNDV